MHYPRRLLFIFLGSFIASTSLAANDVFHMPEGITSLDFVTVGNPGNAPDTRYNGHPVGSVDYVYQMGKYEVTAGQYTVFLNAVAKSDPHGLFNLPIYDPINGRSPNIRRAGTSGNYIYYIANDWINRPITHVSFWNAARFANWLSNGQPTGPEGPSTTEAGAYHDVGIQSLFGRNPGAKFYIPNEDEWYKAAYHNTSAGLAANYFDYPTGSNAPPINTLLDLGNNANIYDEFGVTNHRYAIGNPYFFTDVGTYAKSASPYGTYDQGGNVWEWNETKFDTTSRGMRGGSYNNGSDYLHAAIGYPSEPANIFDDVGFRVASPVPEPSTAALAVVTCGLMYFLKRTSVVTHSPSPALSETLPPAGPGRPAR